MYFNEAFEKILENTSDLEFGNEIKDEMFKNEVYISVVRKLAATELAKVLLCSTTENAIQRFYASTQTNILLGILIGREMGRLETHNEQLEKMLGV